MNLMQVTEKEVCYGLLKSMQLMDLVEMHRWYTVALALCTSDDTAFGSYSDRRGRTPKDSNKKPKATAGTCCGDDSVCGHSGTTLPAVDGQGGAGGSYFSDFSTASPTSTDRETAAESAAAAATAAGAVSASDEFAVPSNVRLRYFFALCETTSADRLLETMSLRESAPPSKTRDRGATPTAPPATAPPWLPTPATTEGSGGNCYTSLG